MVNPFLVKVCGVSTAESAVAVASSGADAVGLNFVPESPRFLPGDAEEAVLASIPDRMRRVGVFVNAPRSEIETRWNACALQFAQLHGDEPFSMIRDLPSGGVILAVRLRQPGLEELKEVAAELERIDARPAALLVEPHVAGVHGGAGKALDWESVGRWRSVLGSETPLILAGGLRPANVAEAIRLVQPTGVDTASGVESAPGVKDPVLSREFTEIAKRELEAATRN